MPIEVKLDGLPFGVSPLPDVEDGKRLVILNEKADTVYLVPLDADAVGVLIQKLQTPNKELAAEMERNARVAEAVEPGEAQVENGGPAR